MGGCLLCFQSSVSRQNLSICVPFSESFLILLAKHVMIRVLLRDCTRLVSAIYAWSCFGVESRSANIGFCELRAPCRDHV